MFAVLPDRKRLIRRIGFVLLCLCWKGATLAAAPPVPSVQQSTPRANQTEDECALCPPHLTSFRADPAEPVFTAAPAGQWDARIRERGWILKEADGWHLWYTGYDGTATGLRKLGYATSGDGIHWERYPRNPLDSVHWIEDMQVVPHAGKYYMFAEGEHDQAQLLLSKDKRQWDRIGTLDIRTTNGQPLTPGPFGTPAAWVEGETWYLLYERRDKGVWLAASTDLKVWKHVQDDPVLVPGPADYDSDMIAVNQVIRDRGLYYAIYHGRGKVTAAQPKPPWSTGLAVSSDRLHWRKCAENPLFPRGADKSSGIFVQEGNGRLLYTLHHQGWRHVPQTGSLSSEPR